MLIGAIFGAVLGAVGLFLGASAVTLAGALTMSAVAGVLTVITNLATGRPWDENLLANMLLVGLLARFGGRIMEGLRGARGPVDPPPPVVDPNAPPVVDPNAPPVVDPNAPPATDPTKPVSTDPNKPPAGEDPNRTQGGQKTDEQLKAERAARQEKFKQERAARQRAERLKELYEEADAKAKKQGKSSALEDLTPDNRKFVEASARNRELSFDPAHEGWTNQSVAEARAMLDAEARGLVKGPVTRNLNNTSDFETPDGEIDHYGPKGRNFQDDVDSLVGKLTDKSYDIYLDSSALDAAGEQNLIDATKLELARLGKPQSLINRVISSRLGRLAP
jgi:hypothetical protein